LHWIKVGEAIFMDMSFAPAVAWPFNVVPTRLLATGKLIAHCPAWTCEGESTTQTQHSSKYSTANVLFCVIQVILPNSATIDHDLIHEIEAIKLTAEHGMHAGKVKHICSCPPLPLPFPLPMIAPSTENEEQRHAHAINAQLLLVIPDGHY
jgi:hypothetical protein